MLQNERGNRLSHATDRCSRVEPTLWQAGNQGGNSHDPAPLASENDAPCAGLARRCRLLGRRVWPDEKSGSLSATPGHCYCRFCCASLSSSRAVGVPGSSRAPPAYRCLVASAPGRRALRTGQALDLGESGWLRNHAGFFRFPIIVKLSAWPILLPVLPEVLEAGWGTLAPHSCPVRA